MPASRDPRARRRRANQRSLSAHREPDEDTSTMKPRLSGFIVASALVTLDGTATTIALPAMARELTASVAHVQWIVNAPLLVLAAMLLPAGALADRFGRT